LFVDDINANGLRTLVSLYIISEARDIYFEKKSYEKGLSFSFVSGLTEDFK
jgi:hypothetical protein